MVWGFESMDSSGHEILIWRPILGSAVKLLAADAKVHRRGATSLQAGADNNAHNRRKGNQFIVGQDGIQLVNTHQIKHNYYLNYFSFELS